MAPVTRQPHCDTPSVKSHHVICLGGNFVFSLIVDKIPFYHQRLRLDHIKIRNVHVINPIPIVLSLSTMGSFCFKKFSSIAIVSLPYNSSGLYLNPVFFQTIILDIHVSFWWNFSEVCTQKCSPTWSSMYETTVNPKAASGLPPHPSAKYPTESSGAFELVGHEEAFPPSPLRPDEVIATC